MLHTIGKLIKFRNLPPKMAFEYEAVINVKIGLIIEDHILGDTADVPLAELFTFDGSLVL